MSDDAEVPEHDALFKDVFEQVDHAAAYLRSVLPEEVVRRADWQSLRVESGLFRSAAERELRSDLLFSLQIDGRRVSVYVLVEHQSSPEPLMALRMLGYLAAIWQRPGKRHLPLPPILPIVVFHDERPWSAPLAFHDLFRLDAPALAAMGPHLPSFRLLIDDLTGVDEEALHQRALTDVALLALLLLKRARYNPNLAADLERWFELFRRVATAPNGIAAVARFLGYATRVGDVDPDCVIQIARRLGPSIQEAYMTGAERLIQRGLEKGRMEGLEQGLEQGLERGRAEGRAEFVLKQLRQKFGALSRDAEARVLGAGMDELDRFAERVLVAQRLADVLVEE